jgi:hypothetical protein
VAQTNIIELNGKRYDASDGTLLGDGVAAKLQHAELRRGHRGRSMDIMPKHRAEAQNKIAEHAVHKKTEAAPASVQPLIHVKADIVAPKHHAKRQTKVVAAHQPQKSQILMRTAVKKPAVKMKESIKTQAPTEMAAAPIATIVPKASAYRLEPRRAARALSVARSQNIRRFAPTAAHNVGVATAQQQPMVRTAARPNVARPGTHPARQTANPTAKPTEHHDIFEAAIAHASSHLEPAPKVSRRRNRWLHVTVVALVFLSIGATVTWANKANIEMHFASIHAGFHIVLPTYTPDGYTLVGNVTTDNGKATLTYHSGDASFAVTEQASSWDSATLANSTVALQNSPQIMQTAGRDVYLYGNGNAMWVDGGVLYNLMANGSLSNTEIANLAATL